MRAVVVFLAVCSPALAQQEAVSARLAKAFEAIDTAAAMSTLPGVVIAITDRDRTLKIVAHGYADLKTKVPLTPESRFEIGSVTKSFTAIALMQLSDEGRFDPQAPVTKYLPWFEAQSRFPPITGHHLLTHTAGLQNYRPDLASAEFATYSLRDFVPSYAPGEHFWYSNIGFQTLGYLLERIEGARYPAIIQRRILDKVGMPATVAVIDDALRAKLPASYSQWTYTGDYVEEPWFEYRAADGSIASTAADMAAYARLILNRGVAAGGRVLSEHAFAALTTPVLDNYAYGLVVRQSGGDTIIGHNGGIAGFGTFLEVHMNDGFGVVAFGTAGIDPALTQWAANAIEAAIRNKPLPSAPQRPPLGRVMNAAEYAGSYTSPDGKTVEFVASGDRLSLKRGDTLVALSRSGRDSFRATPEDLISFPFSFARDSLGRDKQKVVEVAHGPDWYASAAYNGPKQFDTPPEYRAYVGRYENHNPESGFVRVFIRKGKLMFGDGLGDGAALVPMGPGLFRPSAPDYNPERYSFDSIVEGRALRLISSGMPMYRVETTIP
jgi:D-alanyl-D-alanine carboxypeptidase